MGEKHKSSSEEQMIAEQYIFKAIEKQLQINLEHDRKIYLADMMNARYYAELTRVMRRILRSNIR